MFKQNKKSKKIEDPQEEKPGIKDIKNVEEPSDAEPGEIVVDQEAEIKKLAKKAEEYLNGWKRCQADFENYKKMQAEAQKDFMKYATMNIVLQIIPVLDNFHISTDHIPENQKESGWVVGIMHIQKQLENVLADNGVEEITTKIGDKFNPEMHEAISDSNDSNKQHSNDSNNQKVKKIIMKGYKMGGKIIRPVKVIVE
jgi:molecular chaperone GrpE